MAVFSRSRPPGVRSPALMTVSRLLRRMGVDVRRYAPAQIDETRLALLLAARGIATVLDIGANEGQFALNLRHAGFEGEIVSYEPVSSAYEGLSRRAALDRNWTAVKAGVGRTAGQAEINVAANSQISSFLPTFDSLRAGNESMRVVGRETVSIETLKDILQALPSADLRKVALKMDVQGFELEVLKGGEDLVKQLGLIYTEMPLKLSYVGEPRIWEISPFIEALGFSCVGISAGFVDKRTYEMLQVDGTFVPTQ